MGGLDTNFESVGSPSMSLNWNDIKHTSIYLVIFFATSLIGDAVAQNWVNNLHQITPMFEYVEHSVGSVLFLLSVLLKKWVQDNEIFVKK
jgi:hypothetical protein